MESQPSGIGQQFPARLDRRLSRLFLAFALAFLVAGGISVALAVRIHRGNQTINEEYGHVLAIERIDTVFDRIINELLTFQVSGFDRPEAVGQLSDELLRRLDAFRGLHRNGLGSPEEETEVALIDDLRAFAAELRQLMGQATTLPGFLGRLDTPALDRLSLISRQVPERAETLKKIHHARISQLIASGQRSMSAIAFVYLWFLLIGGTLIAIASVSFRQTIAIPLRHLASAVLRIAEGRLDERVSVPSSDEIGQLSQAFNIMTDRLQAHEAQLQEVHSQLEQKVRATQALYRIGLDISSLHQVDGVLLSVAEKSRELLGADASAICLVSSEGELLLQACSGPPDAFRSDAQSVAGTPPSAEPWMEMDRLACRFIQDRYVRSRLAAPIRQGDRVIGLLGVFQGDSRSFTAEDEELLRALATQAAIALQHARLHDELQSHATIEERARLAREIHDGLAQCLSLLYTKLRRAEGRISSGDDELETIRDLALITERAYDDLRQAIFDLRVMTSRERGFVSTLAEYIREFTLQTGIRVNLSAPDGPPPHLPLASEVQLIRILQEALGNVRKHSGTSQAWVRLESWDGGVKLTIEDGGRGCDAALLASPSPLHFGLRTMRERAESLGGKLELDSSAGNGMRVSVILPEVSQNARTREDSRAPGR